MRWIILSVFLLSLKKKIIMDHLIPKSKKNTDILCFYPHNLFPTMYDTLWPTPMHQKNCKVDWLHYLGWGSVPQPKYHTHTHTQHTHTHTPLFCSHWICQNLITWPLASSQRTWKMQSLLWVAKCLNKMRISGLRTTRVCHLNSSLEE